MNTMFFQGFKRQAIIGTIFFFLLGLGIFKWILFYNLGSDLQPHVRYLTGYLAERSLPLDSLYYWVLFAASFFSTETAALYRTVIIVLACSVALKYLVSLTVLKSISQPDAGNQAGAISNAINLNSWGGLLTGSLLFAAPLYTGDKYAYLGKLGINIWHNSTTIFLLPVAVLLFWQSVKFLESGRAVFLYRVLGLSILNILIKPSFYFAFAPVFLLFTFGQFRFDKRFLQAAGVVFVSGLFLVVIYIIVYFGSIEANAGPDQRSGIIVAPFAVWQRHSDNLLADAFLSLVYPACFLALNFKEIKDNLVVRYTAAIFFLAVVIFSVMAESGPRFHHGNFIWQVIVANFILYLVCLSYNLKFLAAEKGISKKNIFLLFVYALHVVSGFWYLKRYLVDGTYL